MRHVLLLAPLAALLFAASGVGLRAQAQAADPWVGTWRVNVAKSRYAPGPAPKSTINVVAAVTNGIRTVNDTVTADGRTTHTEVTARFDGREYELTGAAVPTTRVYTRHGRGFVFVVRENGKETVSTTVVVSDDRRTITATSTGTDREGRRVNNVQVFERQ